MSYNYQSKMQCLYKLLGVLSASAVKATFKNRFWKRISWNIA